MSPLVIALFTTFNIIIGPENRCSEYDVSDYSYNPWIETKIVQEQPLMSLYTGKVYDSTRDTDIEHIVSRREAHDSGMCNQPKATRKKFANDLLNLTLAAPHINRVNKRDKDASEWQPPLIEPHCWFSTRILRVKSKYNLTVDPKEAVALYGMHTLCDSTNLGGL